MAKAATVTRSTVKASEANPASVHVPLRRETDKIEATVPQEEDYKSRKLREIDTEISELEQANGPKLAKLDELNKVVVERQGAVDAAKEAFKAAKDAYSEAYGEVGEVKSVLMTLRRQREMWLPAKERAKSINGEPTTRVVNYAMNHYFKDYLDGSVFTPKMLEDAGHKWNTVASTLNRYVAIGIIEHTGEARSGQYKIAEKYLDWTPNEEGEDASEGE